MFSFLKNRRRRKAEKKEDDGMEKYGFYIHYVPSDPDAPNEFNCHTHGVAESFSHPDFQICLPIKPTDCGYLMHLLVDQVRKGVRFEAAKPYPQILGNGYLLSFVAAKECGREVLRLLLPDVNGTFEGDTYKNQMTMLEHV